MRFPGSKIYRAFPELDRFSDEQCWNWMQSARRARRWRLFGASIASVTLGAVAAIGLMFGNVLLFDALAISPNSTAAEAMIVIWGIGAPVLVFALTQLLIRDVFLRRAIREQLKSTRCTSCDYQLISLPIKGNTITCAECGQVFDFFHAGMTAEDFMGEATSE